jgi:DNA-binding MarR family transcriptional regulator
MPKPKAGARPDGVEAEILRLLGERGEMYAIEIARALGLPWSSLQWRLYRLEREGYIVTRRGPHGRRLVRLRHADPPDG